MRRLSERSTTVPATNTSAMKGRNCASPIRPSAQALWVSAYICQPRMTACIWVPNEESARAQRRATKPGLSRRLVVTGQGVAREQGSKQSFFEKKDQKTFASPPARAPGFLCQRLYLRRDAGADAAGNAKVFWSFFSKKDRFLP